MSIFLAPNAHDVYLIKGRWDGLNTDFWEHGGVLYVRINITFMVMQFWRKAFLYNEKMQKNKQKSRQCCVAAFFAKCF